MKDIALLVSPEVSNGTLNALFAASWSNHEERNFSPILQQSLAYVCAYSTGRLVGFVNLAWDSGVHAFLLNTTVHPEMQRRGVGTALVAKAVEVAKARGVSWLHVDYEPHLEGFYARCGFQMTSAGLLRLSDKD